ncbi:hypothetical protein H1R20_g13901, partial [Candolleomyces eurysporus]
MLFSDLRRLFADLYRIGCLPSAYAPSELLALTVAFTFSFADSAGSDAEAICVGRPNGQYQYR